MPKLTLSADKDTIERAKRLAAERGTSVSALFSQFVESMSLTGERSSGARTQTDRLAPLTKQALGLVKLPSDKSDRQLITEALAEQ